MKFEVWTQGDNYAPDSLRKKKSRDKAKGKEKREKLKMQKEDKRGQVKDKMNDLGDPSGSGAGGGVDNKKLKKGKYMKDESFCRFQTHFCFRNYGT